VIFGNHSSLRGKVEAISFGASTTLSPVLQRTFPKVSVLVLNVTRWIMMILVLLLVRSDITDRLIDLTAHAFNIAFARSFFQTTRSAGDAISNRGIRMGMIWVCCFLSLLFGIKR
jgi:hypothetical protein